MKIPSLPQIKKRALNFNLPDWQPSDFQSYKNSVRKLEIIKGDVTKTFRFEEVCKALLDMSERNPSGIVKLINYAIDIRAFTYLLDNVQFLKNILKNLEIFDHLATKKISYLSLLQLIRTLFNHFLLLQETYAFPKICALINAGLANISDKQFGTDLHKLAANKELIFQKDGPRNIAGLARSSNQNLDVIIKQIGLTGYSDSSYLQSCHNWYYIEALKNLKVGEDHEILHEIKRPEVYESPAGDGQLLGHTILEIMINKCPARNPPELWQAIILSIAGDPRISKQTSLYQKWWAALDEELVQKVKAWLVRFDLSLFLKILEDYGQSSGKSDLKRMFPARRQFLEGLLETGLIVQSRLFLNNQASNYIRRNYSPDQRPKYAYVQGTSCSIIYLQIGHLHMIEGTHSFSIRLVSSLPKSSRIRDYSKDVFSVDELNYIMVKTVKAQNPQAAILEIPHHGQNFQWQHKAIEFFRQNGLRIDIEKLFSGSDYISYKRRYGI